MIKQETVQQILSRIDIIEIIGGFVKLKKRGANYLGLCPFHNEKTPSFTVSPSKEIYKCFGCGRSGNTISFLMEHEKYSYVEALRWLASKYNVDVEETETSPEFKRQQQTADSLYIINSFAQRYFSSVLFNEAEGQDVGLSYLKERGFREEIILKFQLGYSLNEWDAFTKEALKAQFNPELLQKSGLVIVREDRTFDNYRGRIIFPVHNHTGKIIGFGARVVGKADKGPKYINSPENEIYIKSKILYGSYFARQAIDKADECLLVEGYTDVVSLHQAGIENVVASGGTSLTPDQLRLIRKYSNNLTIIYDGDSAGVKAALRGLDLALEEGLNVKLILIPDNEDPDSYVNKIGPTAFREFVAANKKDFIIFQLEISMEGVGDDANRKSAVVNQMAETISRINKAEDFTKQQEYIRRCSEILKIDETGLTALVNKFIREKISKQENKLPQEEARYLDELNGAAAEDDSFSLLFKDELQERAMVRSLLEFGLKEWNENQKVADHILEEIEMNGLNELVDNKKLLKLIQTYANWYKEGLEPTPRSFLYSEDLELSGMAVGLMETAHELSPNWKEHYDGPMPTREDLYREEVFSTLTYLKMRKIKRMIDENQKDLEKELDPEKQFHLIQTHQHLKQLESELTRKWGTVIFR